MDRNIVQKLLIGLFISACLFMGLRMFNIAGFNDKPSQTEINTNVTTRMTYGRLGKTSRFI
jgi:hypothetical protein